MLNSSTLICQQDSITPTINVKLILKLPKSRVVGEVLVCLMMLTKVSLTPIGKLTGFGCDRYNWCYIDMTGTVAEIIQAAVYLQALAVKVKVTAINLDLVQ